MEKEKFAHYLKTLSRTLNIPIAYAAATGKVELFQPFSIITNETDIGFITARLKPVFDKFPDKNVMYCITSHFVMLGIVINKKTDGLIFVGPIASASTTDKEIKRYLKEAELSTDTTYKLYKFMSEIKPLSQNGLIEMLSNINLILNDEICSPYEIVAVCDDETPNKVAFAQTEYAIDMARQNQHDNAQTDAYNKKLNYCITNGDLDGLSNLLYNIDNAQYAYEEYTDNFFNMRIMAFSSIFAIEYAALKSGIPSADLENTKKFYLNRINSSTSVKDLQKLIVNSVYEFTKLVKAFLINKTDNPTINRAIDYIKNNITTKLVAEDIAAALNINKHYLFTKFKKETGKTLTQFINEEKIKKSQYYLQFTDKTLAEIAACLSFSSQSYFQSVFKKITGQTPSDWRKANAYSK